MAERMSKIRVPAQPMTAAVAARSTSATAISTTAVIATTATTRIYKATHAMSTNLAMQVMSVWRLVVDVRHSKPPTRLPPP